VLHCWKLVVIVASIIAIIVVNDAKMDGMRKHDRALEKPLSASLQLRTAMRLEAVIWIGGQRRVRQGILKRI